MLNQISAVPYVLYRGTGTECQLFKIKEKREETRKDDRKIKNITGYVLATNPTHIPFQPKTKA